MEISIFLTILLMVVSLGGLLLHGGKICLISPKLVNFRISIKYNLLNIRYGWAVKLVLRGLYLLNNVIITDATKASQTTLIQLQNIKFEG